jgi:hypothetical protein
MLAGEREGDQLLTGGRGQLGLGGPALQQPQHRRCAEILAGQGERRRIGGLQVRAQPVEQPALVAGGTFVVTGDRAHLPTELAVRDQRPEPGVLIQGEQAADPRVLASSFFRAGPRRRATRSGLTGTTVNPASSSASTSRQCRVSSTTRTSAGSGSSRSARSTSAATPSARARSGTARSLLSPAFQRRHRGTPRPSRCRFPAPAHLPPP